MGSTVGRGHWPGSLVSRTSCYTTQMGGAEDCGLGWVGMLPGIPGQVGLQAMFTIGCDHSLGSLPGPGHRLCSAIRRGLRLRSAAGWSGRLGSMMAGLYAGL